MSAVSVCLGLAIGIVALLHHLGPALAEEAGRPDWILEYFGEDVSILRTGPHSKASAVGLQILLSCDGRNRRMRLQLPEKPAPQQAAVRNGFLLIQPAGSRGGRSIMAAFEMADDRTLIVQDSADGGEADPIFRLGQLLATRPRGLNLLIRPKQTASFGRLASYDLPLRFGPGDLAAIGGFVAGCDRSSRVRPDTRG